MSSAAPAATAAATDAGEAKKSSRRRRTPENKKKRASDGAADAPAAADAAPVAKATTEREFKPRPPPVPLPSGLIGTKVSGRVSAIIRKGRARFGFISVGPADAKIEELPRVYFTFDNLADPTVTIRNRYLVEFQCNLDDKDRPYATQVALTAEGKVAAAEREAEVAAAKAAGAEANAGKKPKRERPARERKPREVRNVTVTVTCEGKSGEQRIEVNTAGTVGRLKTAATAAFEAPLTYNVYHVTKADPKGVYLTKAIMATFTEESRVHLGAPTEAPATNA